MSGAMQKTPIPNAQRASTWIDDIESRSNLSRSQFLMWLGQAIDRDAPIYNTVFAWRLKGKLDTSKFEDAFNHTSTEWAPWYIIPADRKWFTRLAVVEIILSSLEKLKLRYPTLSEDGQQELLKSREMLENEE